MKSGCGLCAATAIFIRELNLYFPLEKQKFDNLYVTKQPTRQQYIDKI
jgi:hypothetical protein